MSKDKSSPNFLKKHPLSVGCALLSLLLIAAIVYRRDAMPSTVTDLEDKAVRGERLKANITNSAQLTEQREALVKTNAAVSSRLVKASELAKNLQYFYRMEAETGTKYIELRQQASPTAVKPGNTYLSVPYTLTVEGSYLQLVTLLRRLENGKHFCRILNATLAGKGSGEPSAALDLLTLTMNLELLGQP